MAVNPKSLANLRPIPFKPGNPGGPGRPPNAGRSMIEHRNDFAQMSEQQVQATADDATETISRRTAAREWLRALAGDRTALTDICDYTHRKPTNHSETDTTIRHQRNVYIDDASGN